VYMGVGQIGVMTCMLWPIFVSKCIISISPKIDYFMPFTNHHDPYIYIPYKIALIRSFILLN
jgi:hypothetical protein